MAESQPQEEEWEKKVLKQLEFYFSDSNYPKDKYLRAQAALDEKGFVSIAVICSFSRMKQLGATDPSKLVDISRKSDKLEVNEAGTMVKRAAPLPTEVGHSTKKTVFTKGWPKEMGFEEIEKVVAAHGKVACVRVRKTLEKTSKGSAFVEFETEEQAKELASAGTFKAFDKDIIVKMKQQWHIDKKEKRKQKKYPDPSKKRKAEDDLEEEMLDKRIKAEDGSETKVKIEKPKQKNAEGYLPGCIIEVKGLDEKTTRDMIKLAFGKYGKVKFVEHQFGQKEAFVRMEQSDSAKKALDEVAQQKLEISSTPVEIRLVDGEEEKKYWEKVQVFAKQKKSKKSKRGGRRF